MSQQTHRIIWNGIGLTVTYTPLKWGVIDHIEIETDNRQPLPITETGYKSCHIEPDCMADYDGPVAFVIEWLDLAAKEGRWHGAQLSLF